MGDQIQMCGAVALNIRALPFSTNRLLIQMYKKQVCILIGCFIQLLTIEPYGFIISCTKRMRMKQTNETKRCCYWLYKQLWCHLSALKTAACIHPSDWNAKRTLWWSAIKTPTRDFKMISQRDSFELRAKDTKDAVSSIILFKYSAWFASIRNSP